MHGRRILRAQWQRVAGIAIGLIALLGDAAPLRAQSPTPAGTVITAWAEVSYAAPNGQSYAATSNLVLMTVAQVAGVDLTPPRASVANPGARIAFAHTVTNLGNGTDSMALAAASAAGWTVRVYRDTDGNGTLGAGDTEILRPITLAMGASAPVLAVVDVPASATVRGMRDSVRVTATSQFDSAVTDVVLDVLDIQDVGVLVALSKQVDRPVATTGDVLTYTITYTVTGINPATNLVITDPIPLGATYVPGSLRWNGSVLTDGAGDAGSFDIAGNRVVFQLGDVPPGQTGTVSFQVRISG